MADHPVVSSQQWLAARQTLLVKEKEFTKLRDQLNQARRDLPWEKVEKPYLFDGPEGKESLAELFAGRSQLMIYHFMFGPDWPEGCPACSMIADHYDGFRVHLQQRDVTLVTVSRAPLDRINAFKERMGWSFKWVSSLENDFNWDYHVSFTQEELDSGEAMYNYRQGEIFPATEAPGLSVFYNDQDVVYHTYSTFARGLDNYLGVYHFLDIVPKGRDEESLKHSMAWVRHHDRYGEVPSDVVQLDPGS